MVKRHYQAEASDAEIARAYSANSNVSLKYATEICSNIRGKPLEKASAFLDRVAKQEDFLPLRKYNRKVPHRKGESKNGVKSGRFPEKTCQAFLSLLNSVKANADFKGMDADKLLIVHAFASQGFGRRSFQPKGRISGRRRKRKSAHIEIIAREAK